MDKNYNEKASRQYVYESAWSSHWGKEIGNGIQSEGISYKKLQKFGCFCFADMKRNNLLMKNHPTMAA